MPCLAVVEELLKLKVRNANIPLASKVQNYLGDFERGRFSHGHRSFLISSLLIVRHLEPL
jgi:hypothetical protein